MVNVPVDILITQQGAAARENRKSANQGDTVTWFFRPLGNTFRIVFTGYLRPGIPVGTTTPDPARNPFSAGLPTSSEGRISGTIDRRAEAGLYLYQIVDGSVQLSWLNPIAPGHNFGGVEIPDPPDPPPLTP